MLTAAEEISHRVGIMSHGRLLFDGTISQLRERFEERQSLESMYLALTETNGSPPRGAEPVARPDSEQVSR